MNQIFGILWGIALLYLYPKCGMTAEIWRIRRSARQVIRKVLTWFKLESTLFSRVRQNNRFFLGLSSNLQPWFKVWLCCFLPWVPKISLWSIIFFVLVASAVATVGPGAPSPPNYFLCPPILIHSECFFGASRNDKTTGNNGKRNNNFQTWFSFEVFLIVCKIAGHQLLYINVTQ